MAVAAGVPLSLTDKVSGLNLPPPSENSNLGLAAFESQLDSTFLIHDEGSKVKVKLVQVTNFASKKQTRNGKEGFSLIFQGSQDTILQQKSFVIEHEELGMFTFLIVPINFPNQSAPKYEAVINRLYP